MQAFNRPSKRSSRVVLTTMAAFGTGAALSGCGSNAEKAAPVVAEGETREELDVFENVFACSKKTGKTIEECEAMRAEAAKVAAADAPRYQAKQDCEADYGPGNCVQAEGGQGEEQTSGRRAHFSPFIVAWFSSKSGQHGPLFRNNTGGYQTANGSRVGYGGAPGKYFSSNRAMERARSVPKIKPASQMAIANGFGQSARSAKFAAGKSVGGGGSKGG
jgi:uncharacterized protein YgiB involved in biofilm formation